MEKKTEKGEVQRIITQLKQQIMRVQKQISISGSAQLAMMNNMTQMLKQDQMRQEKFTNLRLAEHRKQVQMLEMEVHDLNQAQRALQYECNSTQEQVSQL